MYNKQNYTWNKDVNYLNTEYFINTLEKLKTYSKCINASGYSVTNSLNDIYNILKYQHAFWVTLSNIAPDTLELEGIILEKDLYYNLAKTLTDEQILNSSTIRENITNGNLKVANSLLFEEDGAEEWFTHYEPQILTNTVIDGTDSSSGFVYTTDITTVDLNGTNGTDFAHILISPSYDINSWKTTFQKSDIDYGYSVRNLFTSEKVLEKMLKNFQIVDLASTEHVDINISHPILIIDGVKAVNGHRILLPHQNDPIFNGVYVYLNKNLILDNSFQKETDYFLFSAYVKEGNTNKEKQFFLDREDGGRYPLPDEEKNFIQADNYIVRNRITYKLLQDHSFTDASYFTQNEPVISIDFNDHINGTNSDYYKISDNNINLEYVNGDEVEKFSHSVENTKFIKKIEKIGNDIFVVAYNSNNYKYSKYLDGTNALVYGTNGTGGVIVSGTNHFLDIYPITGGEVLDFHLISDVNGHFLVNTTSGIVHVKNINSGTETTVLSLPNNTNDFDYLEIGSNKFFFYLTNNTISFNLNLIDYVVTKVDNPTQLRVEYDANIITVYYLTNNKPNSLSIDYNQLVNMTEWKKSREYQLEFFSKEVLNQWEVKNDNLYLKDVQITNLGSGSNFNLNVPKISNGAFRTYDGINDYSILSSIPMNNIKSIVGKNSGSFTIEVKIKPHFLRENMVVYYLGKNSESQSYSYLGNNINIEVPVTEFISFIAKDTDGFPYVLLSTSASKNLKIKSNKKLSIGVETTVSFTYQYGENKSTAKLFFDGINVGTTIDQRNILTSNNTLDIKNITFDQFLIGKSVYNYPTFQGDVSDVRIWDKPLNPAQIVARAKTLISINDILYSNLKGYWKLADVNSYHKEEILGIVSNTENIFNGGLNQDIILRDVTKPKQIQLSNNNLFISENTTSGTNGIYRIDIKDEKTYKFYETNNTLDSIYFEPNTSKLYFLENNNIYVWDNSYTNKTLFYTALTGTIIDFTIVYKTSSIQDLFLYKSDNKIYDKDDVLMFGVGFSSFKELYGKRQIITNPESNVDEEILTLFWKNVNNDINILANTYANSTSGLNFIATYPFVSNDSLIVGADTYNVVDNQLLLNNNIIDSENKYWNLNLKKIHGVYHRSLNKVLILVTTLNGDVQIWQKEDDKYVRFADKNGQHTIFNTDNDVDLTYTLIGNNEFVAILNTENKSITWIQLEKNNKFNWNTVEWNVSLTSDNVPVEIDYIDDITMCMITEKGLSRYISTISTSNSNYNIWNNSLQSIKKTDGMIIGNTGLMFKDVDFEGTWGLSLSNLLYKNDFSDLHVHITDEKRNNGYVVPSWSGYAYMVGSNGLIIRTADNGTSWSVVETNIKHDLKSISFIDNSGFVVGNNGVILYTNNGGDTFNDIILPEDIRHRDWTKVLCYNPNKALLIGNGGTIVHFTKTDLSWTVDKILNDTELTKIAKPILDENLNNNIKLNIKTTNDSDQYQQILTDIIYLGLNDRGNDTFLISGELDLIAHIELETRVNYILPTTNFLKTDLGSDWKQIINYFDLENNLNIALLLNDESMYSIEWDRWVNNELYNLHSVDVKLFKEGDFKNTNKIAYNDNHLITVGDRVSVNRIELYSIESSTSGAGDNEYYIESDSIESQNLKELFTPKLLFLDYYLGRKINLHLEEGGYQIPTAKIEKSILNCFKFNIGEYIEFLDYGTINNQNNFLAFQDYYFLNRRVMDGGVNTFGKMEPWNKYNKRITAISDYDDKCIWEGVINNEFFEDGVYSGTDSTSFFRVINEKVTDVSTYTTGLFEESMATKIQIDPVSNLMLSKNDVLRLNISKTDKTLVSKEGVTLHFYAKSPYVAFNIDDTGVINNGSIKIGYLDLSILNNDGSYLTILEIESKFINEVLEAINLDLTKKGLSNITLSNIDYNVGISIISDYAFVREWNSTNQMITIWDLWNGDIIGDIAYGSKLFIKNLNYFDGNLIHLQDVFNKHILSQSYKLTVNKPDFIYVDGIVNDYTKYYNLETHIKITKYISGTSGFMSNITYPVKYNEDVVYGPQYDLISFLGNVNPIFDFNYEFDLPEHTFDYNNLTKNSSGEFKEFTITKNQIYVGEDLSHVLDFKEGMFFDITRGTESVNRVYLNKIEVAKYDLYPSKKRYILFFDSELANNLQDTSLNVVIRTRNKLYEISSDLEFTDNLMFPLPNGGLNSVELFNKSYFNQTKTSASYAKFILNDDNIRKYISAVIFLDEDNDWNLNIIDWQKDPNLIYRPVDLHELGIDRVFKKAITIEPSNLKTNSNIFVLQNIDIEKYNFRLVDGLSLRELERKYYWVLNADIKNAIIGENDKGLVWYQGDWIGGIWEDGTWYSGTAYDIEWQLGDFYSYKINNNYNLIEVITENNPMNSIWFRGLWMEGNFYNGTWYNGTWHNGTRYNGLWYNGVWHNGLWHNGIFQGGDWYNGTWLSGSFSEKTLPSVWYNGTWLGGDFENGVWKNGIWDQTIRVASRFGTKATMLHKAIWEYGFWKNGEFHSGLTLNAKGEPIASSNIKNSIWYNGIWDKGTFFGGIWKFGRWNNGIWVNGLWQSELQIDTFSTVAGGKSQIKFKQPHYFKNIVGIKNYFMIIGKPYIFEGEIDSNTEDLGYNTKPTKHEIVEINDAYTITILSNVILKLRPFDYGVIRYKNAFNGGTDLDTRTAFIDLPAPSGSNFNGVDIGYNRGTGTGNQRYIGGVGSTYNSNYYMKWGGDNTSQLGAEAVLVDFKKLKQDFYNNPTDDDVIIIRMRAYWWSAVLSGDLQLEFETYKDTAPNQIGTNFSSNEVVDSIKVLRNTKLNISSDNNGDEMGTLVYNVKKRTASIIVPDSQVIIQPDTCYDYTLEVIEGVATEFVPLDNLFYDQTPAVVSHWVDGTWNAGIWEYGYYSNGFFKGGIWVDGVYDNGIFGD